MLSDQFYVYRCFGVVLGDPAVGMSLVDVAHAFGDGRFCVNIRAEL